MRTEPPSPMASALSGLRVLAGRARRWLAARGAATRIALLLVGLAALGAMGYLASLEDPAERSLAWLYRGRKLSADDIDKITQALDAASIPYLEDPSGLVGVKPARKGEALLALAKAKAVPPSLDDLGDEAEADNPWDGPEERERRDHARLERRLKFKIERLDPAIASADVQINRLRKRGGYGAPTEISSIVYLRTEGGRKLHHQAVDGIKTFLLGSAPPLKEEAITIVDQTGRKYLDAGNPAFKEQMQAHAREEDWGEKIAGELRHIPNLGVSVLLEAVPEPPPPPPEVPPPAAMELVLPNGKAVVEPEATPVAPAPPARPTRAKANVWVRVPRSFYLLEFQSRSPNRQPTPEDLEPMRLTTERLIRDAVEIHIPKDDLGVVKIGVIQDDLASNRPLALPAVPESHRQWTWIALVGSAALAGMAAVAALVRLAARRPSARPSRSPWRPGFVADGPSGPAPGPSERVRELIRLNPEAAAGVLQRWIGQGGALP